ncbi:hypothetical protein Y919_05160 [Caloranaerobacter azorensis H53214]|uniref:Uncharacterized protein n=1 Tax=Caloranaerobacter azorensis H53214 TaxID=1156417 RepID=A0A096CVR2_9FIRM|nr:hypothetical protein Y919_05160 [Caloranaerobacter azorensis H53214]
MYRIILFVKNILQYLKKLKYILQNFELYNSLYLSRKTFAQLHVSNHGLLKKEDYRCLIMKN